MSRLLRLALIAGLSSCTAATRPCPCPEPAVPPSLPPSVTTLAPRRVAPAGPSRHDLATESARVTVAAVGDVLPHVSVKMSADLANAKNDKGESTNHEGWDALFADVAPDLSAADLAVANLETPVSPSGDKGTVEYHFNATAPLLDALKSAGIRLVSFANNHVFDQGKKGFAESLDALDKAGIPFYGAGRTQQEAVKGLRIEKNGVKIAFLGASQFFNGKEGLVTDPKQPQANKTDDPAAMAEAVKASRKEADFVIVSAHWGAEYQVRPRESEVKLAHELFEAGADVILGTHPHVLQPLEIYEAQDGRTCLVVYSLGNFISNQSFQYQHGVSPERIGETRDGAILRFSIARRDYGSGGVRAELADVSYLPRWTVNDRVVKGDKEEITIRTLEIEHALKAARQELDAAVAALPKAPSAGDQARIVRLKKQLALYERRREIIEARLGASYAVEHLQ